MSNLEGEYRKTRKAFFLDRDDTIIKDYGYLNDPKKVELLPGVVEALKEIQNQDYLLLVLTNQSGLTRGSVQVENLEDIHKKITDLFSIKGIYIRDYYSAPYYHKHERRKPGPGLFIEAANDWGIDFKKSWIAGDKWRDLKPGYDLGCKALLVNEAKEQRHLFKNFKPNIILNTWEDFTEDLLKSVP